MRTDNDQQLRMYWQQHEVRVWRCSYASRVAGPKDTQRQLRWDLGWRLCFPSNTRYAEQGSVDWMVLYLQPEIANGLGLAFIAVDAEELVELQAIENPWWTIQSKWIKSIPLFQHPSLLYTRCSVASGLE
jgi:hypothetical protein